jgi:hypothetical protein
MDAFDYITAHKHSIYHREELTSSEQCGCFNCLAISSRPQWTNGQTDKQLQCARGVV